MKDHRPSPIITLDQHRSLPPLPSPSSPSSLPPTPPQRATPATASLELKHRSTSSTTRLPSSSTRIAMSPPPKSPTARLHRRAHPSPPTTPSYYGEEDIFFPPTQSREGSMPPTPTSPTFSIPRSTSPHASFVKKFSNKWKGGGSSGSTTRDELDFGCAGEWSSIGGPADLGDRYYSNSTTGGGGGDRASTSSSVFLPSLTHSRAHSSSSEFSTSTVDSSLPPSPTPSSCASLTTTPSSPLQPPLPYTSRVPLTPRTAQRKRQSPSPSEETLATDALNHFFTTSVRLSQIAEDVSPASTARASFSSTYRGASSPPTAADILLSKNHAPPPPPSSEHGFEIEFIDSGVGSTFTPLPRDFDSPSSSHSHSDSRSMTHLNRHSPLPSTAADVAFALEELSEYFSSPSSPSLSPSSSRVERLLPPAQIENFRRPSGSEKRRPTRSGAAGVRIGLGSMGSEGLGAGERRVQYTWI